MSSPAPETPEVRTKRPLDERLFDWALLGGGVVIAVLMVVSTMGRTKERVLADFGQLTDRTGRTVTRGELKGQFLVVNFVFTSCSIACLQVNERMSEIQKRTAGRDDVRLVSFTVDPRTDTPDLLGKFASRFGAETNRWLFLTGNAEVLESLVETSFLPDKSNPSAPAFPGAFADTRHIALVAPDGRITGYFDGFKPDVADQILRAIGQPAPKTTP